MSTLDTSKPPPGWRASTIFTDHVGQPAAVHDSDMAVPLAEAHRIYTEESRPAVVDFAERMAAWLRSDECDGAWLRACRGRDLADFRYDYWVADTIAAHATGAPLPGTEP